MNALRIRKRLDSPIPELPELDAFVGKVVEIVVLEESTGPERPDAGKAAAAAPFCQSSVIHGPDDVEPSVEAPFTPVTQPEEKVDRHINEFLEGWKRLKVMPEGSDT